MSQNDVSTLLSNNSFNVTSVNVIDSMTINVVSTQNPATFDFMPITPYIVNGTCGKSPLFVSMIPEVNERRL